MSVKSRYTLTPPTHPGLWFRKYGAIEKVVEIAKAQDGRLYVVPEVSGNPMEALEIFTAAADPYLWSIYPVRKPSSVDAARIRIALPDPHGDRQAEIWVLDGEILEDKFPEEALKAKLARLLLALYGDVIGKERDSNQANFKKYTGMLAFIAERHPELRNEFNSYMMQKQVG